MANETIFTRYKENPIVEANALDTANGIFNSAVIPFQDRFAGVFRVDSQAIEMELHVGWSDDAIAWEIEPNRIHIESEDPELASQGFGYDPRITKIDDLYYVTWCNDYHGPTIGLASTQDFESFSMICNCFPPFNRNGVLFPRKIRGQYAMLHRPSDNGHTPFGDIYYCTSPDLVHWGNHRHVFGPRGGWQSLKVGAGPVPFEIEEGWLLIYHGVVLTCSGYVYSAGGAILDREEPWKVLYRTRDYLLSPTELYERVGFVPNVVFPNAMLVDEKTRRVSLYYGCADTAIGLAHADLDALVAFIKEHAFETKK